MKEPDTLPYLRTILAMLIALSLALGPIASAGTSVRAQGAASTSMEDTGSAMTDCAKMGMVPSGTTSDFDCPCCDSNSKCPDMGACMVKCGAQAIGLPVPAAKLAVRAARHFRPSDPQEPPDRSLRPPAPPPRS